MQLHAKGLQITNGGIVLRMPTQQPRGGEAKALARSRQGVKVIGVIAAEADQPGGAHGMGVAQVVAKLEPFVAADQRVDQVQPQHGELDTGVLEPGKDNGCKGAWGRSAKA